MTDITSGDFMPCPECGRLVSALERIDCPKCGYHSCKYRQALEKAVRDTEL